jgi:hypothetical protein
MEMATIDNFVVKHNASVREHGFGFGVFCVDGPVRLACARYVSAMIAPEWSPRVDLRFAVDREFRWIAGQRSGRSASHCMPSPMLYTEPYGSV